MFVLRSELWAVMLTIYFSLHVAIRTLLGYPLTPEEMHIAQQAKSFAWSYDGSMPLYFWLQMLVFKAFGSSILALALLKNLLLLMIAIFMHRIVRRVADKDIAWFASLSLVLIPAVIWKAQHGLHLTVLATAVAAATLHVFLKLHDHRDAQIFAGLGALLGLGLLSSLNFAWFIGALIGAGLITARSRPIVLSGGFICALAIAAAIVSPVVWTTQVRPVLDLTLVQDFSYELMVARSYMSYDFLQSAVVFAAVLMAIMIYARTKEVPERARADDGIAALREFLGRLVFIGLAILLAAVFGTGFDAARSEVLMPILVFVAPLATLFIFPGAPAQVRHNFLSLTGCVAVAVLILSSAHYSFSDREVLQTQVAQPNAHDTRGPAL